MVRNVFDDIPDSGTLFVDFNGRIVLDFVVLQGDLNVEDRCKPMLFVVADRDLLCKVGHA